MNTRSQSRLGRLATEVVRRVTHSEFGNLTGRSVDVQLVPAPGSSGNAPDGSLYWVAGVDNFSDETKVF